MAKKSKKKERNKVLSFQVVSDSDGRILIDRNKLGAFISPNFSHGHVVTESYIRDNGRKKKVSQIFLPESSAFCEIERNIVTQFDRIIAIDTNTIQTNNFHLSVCCAAFSTTKLYDMVKEAKYELAPCSVFSSRNRLVNPERIGWHIFLTRILPRLGISKDEKICFVVDSELDNHSSYNVNEKPYFKNYFLPSNIYMAYASSDKTDNSINKAVKFCDSSATQVANQMKAENLDALLNRKMNYVNFMLVPLSTQKKSPKTTYHFYELEIEE